MVTGLAVAMWFAPPGLAILSSPLQVSKPVKTWVFQQYSSSLCTCATHVAKSWSRGLSGRLAGWQTHPEHTWLKLPRCLFFLQLALYPVNSALLVDSAHPGFCVPSSFHWLDLRRLFAGYPNGFRQLLELAWAPEALTKSTLYPALAGMGSRIISQEADLEVLRGQKKAQVRCPSKNRNSE